jgi:hypothetical protein
VVDNYYELSTLTNDVQDSHYVMDIHDVVIDSHDVIDIYHSVPKRSRNLIFKEIPGNYRNFRKCIETSMKSLKILAKFE